MNEFQAEKTEITDGFLAKNASRDGRSFIGHQARRRRRGSWDGQLDNLFQLKEMRAGNASAGRADVKSFCELDKFDSQSVSAPQENRDLNANARIMPGLRRGHRFFTLQELTGH